jgi:HEAT repeat protein
VKAIDVVGNARLKQPCRCSCSSSSCATRRSRRSSTSWPSLGKIGDSSATKPILDFLARDIEPSVRGSAVYALGDIGDRAALPSLEKLAKDSTDENFRGLTQSAIRKIEQKPAPTVVRRRWPIAVPRPSRNRTRPKALRSRGRSVAASTFPLQSLLERLGDERA